MIKDGEIRFIEFSRKVAFSDGNTNGVGNTLSKRTRADFDA
jgi:hypothetical protein